MDGFNSGKDDDVDNQINRQNLMKEYIIPETIQISNDGILKFIFNEKIKVIEDPIHLLQKERIL